MSFKIHLIPDDYHLLHVGLLDNGAMYWIDGQLNPEAGSTHDFIATYVFDTDGRLIWHKIEDLGLRLNPDQLSAADVIAAHKAALCVVKETDIWVSPFSIEAHGLTFGLVVREPESDENAEDDGPFVDALPGWTLMFYPPWEDGEYAS